MAIERFGDLREWITNKSSELFARQQCARMPIEEDQRIQVTGALNRRGMRKQSPYAWELGRFHIGS